MTHYMGLLVANQPWNLILFMAIPVIFAETIAVTELIILFSRQLHGTARLVNRIAGTAIGLYLYVKAAVDCTGNLFAYNRFTNSQERGLFVS